MSEHPCIQCGKPVRQSAIDGLCPHCLLLQVLQPLDPPEPGTPPETNQRWIGPYVLLEEIARGGMGIVFRAKERDLGRVVALKLLRGAEWVAGTSLERFRTEARAAATLVHPHIVPVYSFGDDGGNWYIAMRLIEGGSLADWIRREAASDRGSKRQREAAVIVQKVAEATHHAHQHGVLHRDLKPENVLMDAEGEPYLTDFGMARLADAGSRLTRTQISLGTPAYVAPEVARGGSMEATVLSDVYGLGAILYELLTGHPPFEGSTPLEVLRQVADGEVRRPSSLHAHVDHDLETICLKAISREPARRYESGTALAQDLGRWLTGQPIEARPVGTLERCTKWVRRRPVLATLAALLACSITVITVGSWMVSRNLRMIGEGQRQSIVALNIDTANQWIAKDDSSASLPYQIDSLRLDADHPARSRMHRVRLGLTRRSIPRLTHLWKHDGAANSATFSTDGLRVLSAGADGYARIGRIDGEGTPLVLKHPSPVLQALLSPDSSLVLTLSSDGHARCWDATTGQEQFAAWPVYRPVYKLPLSPVASFSPDGARILSIDGSRLELRDSRTGSLLQPPLELRAAVEQAAFSPDGGRIISCLANGLVQVWELSPSGLHPLGSLRHPNGVTAASFSRSGNAVASVGLDAIGFLWDASDGNQFGVPFRHDGNQRISQASFSPTHDRFVTLSFDNTARIWDGNTGQMAAREILHANGVTMARWDNLGHRIVTGSFDGCARIWNATNASLLQPLLQHGSYVTDAVFSPSGEQLVTSAQDGGIRLWSFTATTRASRQLTDAPISLAFFSPEGSQLALASAGTGLQIHHLLPGAPQEPTLLRPAGREGIVKGTFAPSGRLVATATRDGNVELWDPLSGQPMAPTQNIQGSVSSLSFDSTGERLVATANTRDTKSFLTVWRVPEMSPIASTEPIEEHINWAEFHPTDPVIFSSSSHGGLRFWNPTTGKAVGPFVPGRYSASEAHFSPDGRWIAVAESDMGFATRPGQLWSTTTGKKIGPPLLQQDGTTSAAFSPDGGLLATGTEAGTVRIWRVPSGEAGTPLMPHQSKLRRVLFSPDGSILATLTSSGAVRLWDATTGTPLTASRQLAGGSVSMAFLGMTSEFLAVGGDGVLHRWDCSPADESLEELSRLSDHLSGKLPAR